VLQIEKYTKGMVVAAIANRTVEKATHAFVEAGVDPSVIEECKSAEQLETIYKAGCVRPPAQPLPCLAEACCAVSWCYPS
jgi:predicted homoserine dehydrogenase-like protein